MFKALHSLLALFLVAIATGLAAPAAHAQYGNEAHRRTRRHRGHRRCPRRAHERRHRHAAARRPGAIVDVFVGRSSRTTFMVTADGQTVGQVQLSRQDLDGDGWDDGVLEEITDAKTGAVNEVFFRF